MVVKRAVHDERAADPAVDEIAVCEADVGLETGDRPLLELAAQCGHVARRGDGDASDGVSCEAPQVRGIDPGPDARRRTASASIWRTKK